MESTSKKSPQSKNFYLSIINYIKNGKNPNQISKELQISKQSLNYYIASLKRQGIIRKISYGVWQQVKELPQEEVKKSPQVASHTTDFSNLKPDMVRGHAFMFHLKIPKIKNWDKRHEYMNKIGLKYSTLNNLGNGQKFNFKGKNVHLKNNSIIIYDKNSYISLLASDSRSSAVYEYLTIIQALERLFNVKLTIHKNYVFKVSREHYSLVKNCLAKQYDAEGKKLHVYNSKGLWMLIDNSFNLHETETVKTGEAVIDNEGIQSYLNSHKVTGFKVTPEYILHGFDNLSQVQLREAEKWQEYAKDIVEHKEAIKTLAVQISEFVKEVKKLNKKL